MYKLRIVKGTVDFSKFSDEDRIDLSSFEQEIIEELESDDIFSVLTIRKQRQKLDKYVPKITREYAEMYWVETKDTEKDETTIHEYTYPVYEEFSVTSWLFPQSPPKERIFEELDIIDGCLNCKHCTFNGMSVAYCDILDDWCVYCRNAEEECGYFERYYSKLEKMLYEAYKIDWLRRVSADEHIDVLLEWYEDGEYETLEEYIEERGYDGSIYACLDEFLESEFLDKEYIKDIVGHNEEVYNEYLESVKKEEK